MSEYKLLDIMGHWKFMSGLLIGYMISITIVVGFALKYGAGN